MNVPQEVKSSLLGSCLMFCKLGSILNLKYLHFRLRDSMKNFWQIKARNMQHVSWVS